MRQTSPTLVFRVPWALRARLWQEADLRGVEPSALVRGILLCYLEDVGSARMGFRTAEFSVVRLIRDANTEIRIPRRRRRPEPELETFPAEDYPTIPRKSEPS